MTQVRARERERERVGVRRCMLCMLSWRVYLSVHVHVAVSLRLLGWMGGPLGCIKPRIIRVEV